MGCCVVVGWLCVGWVVVICFILVVLIWCLNLFMFFFVVVQENIDMFFIFIINVWMVNEGCIFDGDLCIENGCIVQIGVGLVLCNGEQVVDVVGCWLLFGMIDDQVYFCELGLIYKGDIVSELVVVVVGGLISFMDMFNINLLMLDLIILEVKYEFVCGCVWVNYGFYYGVSNDNLDVICVLDLKKVLGVKVFMGVLIGNMLVDNLEMLDVIFCECLILIIMYCEDMLMIDVNFKVFQEKYGDVLILDMYLDICLCEVCIKLICLVMLLVCKYGICLYVLYIFIVDELVLFEKGLLICVDGSCKQIIVEICVYFLYFVCLDYVIKGNLIKCNLVIKEVFDCEVIIVVLVDDVLDVLVIDYVLYIWEEKQKFYVQVLLGLLLVQYVLVVVLEWVYEGKLICEQVVQKFVYVLVQLFDVEECGFLCEGYFVDLVLVEDVLFIVKCEDVLFKCGWLLFEGIIFCFCVVFIWVNGQLVWDGSKLVGEFVGQCMIYDC